MEMVRNFIHIIGISSEDQLPTKIRGQLIQYSEIETIHIPDDLPPAKSIFQIMFNVEVKSGRIIETPICRTMVVEGAKNFKIMYTGDVSSDRANLASITTPYNTFIEIPEEYDDIDKVDVFILDAYFSLLDSRKVYSYILYLVNADYSSRKYDTTIISGTRDKFTARKADEDNFEMHEEAIGEMLLSNTAIGDISTPPIPKKIDTKSEVDEQEIDAEYL